MSEEKRKLIEETVNNLKKMDKESLMIIRTGSEMLKARDMMDSRECDDFAKDRISEVIGCSTKSGQ